MKITKRQLVQIIKEEPARVLREQAGALLSQGTLGALNDALERAYYEAVADSMGHHNRGGRY